MKALTCINILLQARYPVLSKKSTIIICRLCIDIIETQSLLDWFTY